VDGRLVCEPASHNREEEERRWRAVQVAVDENTYVAPRVAGVSSYTNQPLMPWPVGSVGRASSTGSVEPSA
jgi:hypothetical protein